MFVLRVVIVSQSRVNTSGDRACARAFEETDLVNTRRRPFLLFKIDFFQNLGKGLKQDSRTS